MRLYLQYDKSTETTREPDTDDSWDRGDTSSSWDFGDVSASKENFRYGYESFDVNDGYRVGDRIYVVVAVWGTGDTFGHDENYCMDVVSAHIDRETAYKSQKKCESNSNTPLYLGDGYILNYIPWSGYFDSFGYSEVLERVII
jgi:hypothetical protein